MKQRELASLSVLGVLAEEQVATLNQIHEKLRHSFGRYWGASTSILIPTISQLEDEGHLNATTADGNYAYEITPAGRDRLKALLRERIEDVSHPSFRPHLLLKLGFLHHLPKDEQHTENESLQDQLYETRDRLLTLESYHGDKRKPGASAGYRGGLIDLRVRIIDTIIDWLKSFK